VLSLLTVDSLQRTADAYLIALYLQAAFHNFLGCEVPNHSSQVMVVLVEKSTSSERSRLCPLNYCSADQFRAGFIPSQYRPVLSIFALHLRYWLASVVRTLNDASVQKTVWYSVENFRWFVAR
jgi:hypothetical protein